MKTVLISGDNRTRQRPRETQVNITQLNSNQLRLTYLLFSRLFFFLVLFLLFLTSSLLLSFSMLFVFYNPVGKLLYWSPPTRDSWGGLEAPIKSSTIQQVKVNKGMH